jgi:UbiD family decarboxylase
MLAIADRGEEILMSLQTTERTYADLHEHLDRLDEAGLLYRINEPVNKDTEMHPLVRWQFRGGIPEAQRKAFLFTNITDSKGRRYNIPVVIGAFAANPEIYRIGMDVPRLEDIGPAWERALANPISPRVVQTAPCHDVVVQGRDLSGPGKGLESLPVPISTPGFDAAPFFTATGVITKDPDTGVQNMGTYRGQLKSSDRLGMMMLVNMRAGGLEHLSKYRARGERMPIAIVVGCPPLVAFQGPQKLRIGVDEMTIAGGLAGGPINMVRGRTVDLMVPAESEVIVEGFVDPEYLEPEGPFGESHGYVALEDYNIVIEVSAITRRRDAILTSMISQVTPSESSVVKRLAYEPLYLAHLRDHLGIKGIQKVVMHEALTNLRRFVFLQFKRGTPRTEVWRALQATPTLQAAVGKFVIAVDNDIDPDNPDSVFWAMSYRCNPAQDTHVVPYREPGHGPRVEENPQLDSAMLIDATMKHPMPPLALPKREYMENAKRLWERLGLPPLQPMTPWFGYSLGDWTEEWDRNAAEAAQGNWMDRSEIYKQRRRKGVPPNTPARAVEKDEDI